MANEKFYVTQEGYNDLVNEHENLVHKVRQEVIVELQEAVHKVTCLKTPTTMQPENTRLKSKVVFVN